jgi:hypothetical protein
VSFGDPAVAEMIHYVTYSPCRQVARLTNPPSHDNHQLVKIYYDTEFLEDGRRIHLISIGMVADDGREFYAVNRDAPWRRVRKNKWLMANVVPHLPKPHGDWIMHMPRRWLFDYHNPAVKRHSVIAEQVRAFVQATPNAELWAWYGAYDHVALAQLWGPMSALPDGIPMWTNDVRQERLRLGDPEVSVNRMAAHNALADARHLRIVDNELSRIAAHRAQARTMDRATLPGGDAPDDTGQGR